MRGWMRAALRFAIRCSSHARSPKLHSAAASTIFRISTSHFARASACRRANGAPKFQGDKSPSKPGLVAPGCPLTALLLLTFVVIRCGTRNDHRFGNADSVRRRRGHHFFRQRRVAQKPERSPSSMAKNICIPSLLSDAPPRLRTIMTICNFYAPVTELSLNDTMHKSDNVCAQNVHTPRGSYI